VDGHLQANPIRQLKDGQKPKPVKAEAPYFTDEELPRLIAQIPEGVYRVYVLTALKTGMRQGELSALRWANVNLGEGHIFVCESFTDGQLGNTKTGAGTRHVELAPEVVTMLGKWWGDYPGGPPADDNMLVFPGATKTGHINPQSLLRRILYPAMTRAKVPRECPEGRARGHKRTFHSFRHTFARVALENGRELTWLQRHLGHTSLEVTNGRYGHWSRAAAKAQAAALEGAFNV
jgi:integrase